MEEALLALLRGSASVTALVPTARINWRRHPQGQPWPGIVLHAINDRDEYAIADVADLSEARVQIDCWATTYGQAKAISRAVRALLSGYQGGVFYQMRLNGARDARSTGTNEPDDPAGVSLDFTFHYRRAF
jgi:hypothetical protein